MYNTMATVCKHPVFINLSNLQQHGPHKLQELFSVCCGTRLTCFHQIDQCAAVFRNKRRAKLWLALQPHRPDAIFFRCGGVECMQVGDSPGGVHVRRIVVGIGAAVVVVAAARRLGLGGRDV